MKHSSKLMLGLFLSVGIFSSSVLAEVMEDKNLKPSVSKGMQKALKEQDGTFKTRGVYSLKDYIITEKVRYDWLFKNHPIFKDYLPKGNVVGKLKIMDRGYMNTYYSDAIEKYTTKKGTTAVTYRLAETDPLKFPNKFVGAKKCGECHIAQYEQWANSRHSTTVRFPGKNEHPELGNDLQSSIFGPVDGIKTAGLLPKGITPDTVYATIGHVRTKFGYFDAWLLRGTYFVEDGQLKDRTGKVVGGSNQWSRSWAHDLTPSVAKKIAEYIPTFPTTLPDFGPNSGYEWGLQSYAGNYRTMLFFQSASSYCQHCHPWKFDFNSYEEFEGAVGNAKKLQDHTISRGISCEECHGAGGHLMGAEGGLDKSNCERCHQRFSYRPYLTEQFRQSKNPQLKVRATELGLTAYFKSAAPSCGSEGSQAYFTAHYDAGMRCTTCHDPHSVTGYVETENVRKGGVYQDVGNYLSSFYTAPKMKKDCASCHQEQAFIAKNTKDTHSNVKCQSCHMPFTMSCENWWSVMYSDNGGFDTTRRSHIWKIDVSPDRKSLNPPPGKPRTDRPENGYPNWYIAKNENGHNYIDLMWACGKTSWSDKDMIDNKGCHSIAQSTLKKTLHFSDQKRIYEEVMGWQKPIKAIYEEVSVAVKGLYELLDVTKLSVEDRSRVNELIENAEATMNLIKKDGSWGVHGFKYTERRAKAAQAYVKEAQSILAKNK